MVVVESGESTDKDKNPASKLKDGLATAIESLAGKMDGTTGNEKAEATGGQDHNTDSSSTSTKPKPQHRFLTRAGAAKRKQQESSLMTAIHQLALETNPDNIHSHSAILTQMLKALEQVHHEYVIKEKLDINQEPEKSYMLDYERKVQLALEKQLKRLGLKEKEAQSAAQEAALRDARNLKKMEEDLNDRMTSVSEVGSNLSTMSRGRAVISRLKSFQKKIEAKGKAIRNVMNAPGIELNQRAIAKAGLVWATIDHLRIEYQGVLDEACDFLDENQMEEILTVDEAQWEWLTEVEARLEELQIMRDSPEKQEPLNDGFTCPKPEPRFGGNSMAYWFKHKLTKKQRGS